MIFKIHSKYDSLSKPLKILVLVLVTIPLLVPELIFALYPLVPLKILMVLDIILILMSAVVIISRIAYIAGWGKNK